MKDRRMQTPMLRRDALELLELYRDIERQIDRCRSYQDELATHVERVNDLADELIDLRGNTCAAKRRSLRDSEAGFRVVSDTLTTYEEQS